VNGLGDHVWAVWWHLSNVGLEGWVSAPPGGPGKLPNFPRTDGAPMLFAKDKAREAARVWTSKWPGTYEARLLPGWVLALVDRVVADAANGAIKGAD
jgi:hypothetical protein